MKGIYIRDARSCGKQNETMIRDGTIAVLSMYSVDVSRVPPLLSESDVPNRCDEKLGTGRRIRSRDDAISPRQAAVV